MARFFIPRDWRWPKVLLGLMLLELPFTVANLALFGIASPNLYRTQLWAEGGKLGFNSDPSTVLYAAANYQPVSIPLVWSAWTTQFNLVIGVLCMFFYLVKSTGMVLHVFFPIISLVLHLVLLALWAVSIHAQTAPDTIDPKRENHGPPWYITKNCDIVDSKTVRGYCQQAKSAFAISVCMLVLYAFYILLSIYSLYPTKAARAAHETRQSERRAEKEKFANSPYDREMTAEEQWQHMWELQQLPRTPGTATALKSPYTPRTRAFNELGGAEDDVPPTPAGYYGDHIYKSDGMGQGTGLGVQHEGYEYEGKGKGTAY